MIEHPVSAFHTGASNPYPRKLLVAGVVYAHLALRFSGILKPIQENSEGGAFACQLPSTANM
jgi:hypothetical protein